MTSSGVYLVYNWMQAAKIHLEKCLFRISPQPTVDVSPLPSLPPRPSSLSYTLISPFRNGLTWMQSQTHACACRIFTLCCSIYSFTPLLSQIRFPRSNRILYIVLPGTGATMRVSPDARPRASFGRTISPSMDSGRTTGMAREFIVPEVLVLVVQMEK